MFEDRQTKRLTDHEKIALKTLENVRDYLTTKNIRRHEFLDLMGEIVRTIAQLEDKELGRGFHGAWKSGE